MGLHLVEEACRRSPGKFLQVGTVCSDPKHTNAPYGVAKRALLEMLQAYRRQSAGRARSGSCARRSGPGRKLGVTIVMAGGGSGGRSRT